ncbi:MAG TPA: phage/plasmid primase, P4 family, partial [Chthoniobacterales bacterium]|nr:phage/plasmid primase, P4 family [Chthoniobacterales bacterium]
MKANGHRVVMRRRREVVPNQIDLFATEWRAANEDVNIGGSIVRMDCVNAISIAQNVTSTAAEPMKATADIPPRIDRDLWRIVHGMFPPDREIGIDLFESLARSAANYCKSRPGIERADVSAWLQQYSETRDLRERFGVEKVQFALERAFNFVFGEEDEPNDSRLPEFSDDALALTFADRHKDELRYVAKWGQWQRYDGICWREDTTLHVYDFARKCCRDAAASIGDGDWSLKKALTSNKTIAAVERLARTDRRLAATVDQWDCNPMILNTPGAVIDLRTGKSGVSSPFDYLTKMTAVTPGGDCPTWNGFLSRIANNDAELVGFIQRMIGYSLTGVTKEHALFFCYGTGANGKSVLIDTIANILADYHSTASMETFTASASDRHTTEIARLRGARLVTAVETEKGRAWAEARIKTLTGGDKVTARFMRQDDFQFTPQ